MDKTINEILIKISSRCPIDKELELGQDVSLLVRGTVVSKQENDNQDGTYDVIIKCKPVTTEIMENGSSN